MQVRYDKEVDALVLYSGSRIVTSSSVEDCLIADYGSEDGFDVVGIEFLAFSKLVAHLCDPRGYSYREAEKYASTLAPLKADYDREKDVLTVKSGHPVEFPYKVESSLIVHMGYEDSLYTERYSVVGFELHNASECLAPYFKLNRAPLAATGSSSD